MKLLNRAPLGFMQSRIMPDTFDIADIIKVGLVAYWKMDETSGTRADSIPVPIDTVLAEINTVGSASGVIGNGALLVASNMERLNSATNGDLEPAGSFTIAGWVKFNTLIPLDLNPIYHKFSSTVGERDYTFFYNNINQTWRFLIGGADAGNTISNLAIADVPTTGDWHFFCTVYNAATATITATINDTLTGSLSAPNGLNNGPRGFNIGSNGDTPNDWLDGVVDEVGMWHRALSPAECSFLYNNRLGRTYPFDPSDIGVGAFTNGFTTGFWSEA